MNFSGLSAAVIAAGVGFAGMASATTLTFEGVSNTEYNAPIVRQGYTIGNVAGEVQHFHEIDSTTSALVSNGTGVLLNDRDTRLFIESTVAFTLGSFDASGYFAGGARMSLAVEGFLGGVSTGQISLAISDSAFSFGDGTALGNVDRLVFDGQGGNGYFALDNIALAGGPIGPVSTVPLPAGLPLLLVALGGVGLMGRRQRA